MPETISISPIQSAHILAIVGEAIANAARHAQAKNVQLRAVEQDGNLVIYVIDDGVGFVLDKQEMGYGLRNMRDRARIIGGNLAIVTTPQQGTKIKLIVPRV